MSALGHKRTYAPQKVMSALPPEADMCSAPSACPLSANSGHRTNAAYGPRRTAEVENALSADC